MEGDVLVASESRVCVSVCERGGGEREIFLWGEKHSLNHNSLLGLCMLLKSL